ncbi:MAG: SpoIVB peptidase S55 domain-containing protein, partial [Nocardioides sp.]
MRSRLAPAAGSRHRRAGVGLAAVAALAVTGLGAAPARSATDPACPDPYPVSALTKGQPVTGLTVASGTVPEGFTGQVLGVQQNGLMPGLDLVLVRLTSPELERVGGIWSGMSGSPVYAADGRLIGAVSLGLTSGPSTVAGVTPAADMLELLSSSPARLAAPSRVALPRSLARTIVREGDATAQQVADGLSPLELPFGIAGLGSQTRLSAVAKRLPLEGVRVV